MTSEQLIEKIGAMETNIETDSQSNRDVEVVSSLNPN